MPLPICCSLLAQKVVLHFNLVSYYTRFILWSTSPIVVEHISRWITTEVHPQRKQHTFFGLSTVPVLEPSHQRISKNKHITTYFSSPHSMSLSAYNDKQDSLHKTLERSGSISIASASTGWTHCNSPSISSSIPRRPP